VLAVGSPALALAAAIQLLTPPLTAVDPVLATARAGSGQVLSVTTPAATDTPAPAPTDAPTAAPTPDPTAQPTVAVATPAPPPPATAPPAPPPPPRSRLVSDDGRVDTGVGVYSDCTGRTDVPHAYAAIDTCVGGGRTYFVGHNPGVFTPLLSESVGSVITWWDANGTAHRLQIVARRDWLRDDGVPPPVSGAVTAQFQTCLVPDGSRDLILDAVAA
jgi:hypothetical protein